MVFHRSIHHRLDKYLRLSISQTRKVGRTIGIIQIDYQYGVPYLSTLIQALVALPLDLLMRNLPLSDAAWPDISFCLQDTEVLLGALPQLVKIYPATNGRSAMKFEINRHI